MATDPWYIVGFDLRQRPVLDWGATRRLGDYWPTDMPEPGVHPATISEIRWPRSAALTAADMPTNGANLFSLPDLLYLDREAMLAAFSVSETDRKRLQAQS